MFPSRSCCTLMRHMPAGFSSFFSFHESIVLLPNFILFNSNVFEFRPMGLIQVLAYILIGLFLEIVQIYPVGHTGESPVCPTG
jgi:hypothetical protein